MTMTASATALRWLAGDNFNHYNGWLWAVVVGLLGCTLMFCVFVYDYQQRLHAW